MKVIWKGDEERTRCLDWHGVLFAPGKETELPDDFPSMAKVLKSPLFTVVAEKPAPAAHPASTVGKR